MIGLPSKSEFSLVATCFVVSVSAEMRPRVEEIVQDKFYFESQAACGRDYEKINEYLEKNVDSNEAAANFDALGKWLLSPSRLLWGPPAKAIRQLLELKTTSECNWNTFVATRKNLNAINDSALATASSSNRVHRIVGHQLEQQARTCRSGCLASLTKLSEHVNSTSATLVEFLLDLSTSMDRRVSKEPKRERQLQSIMALDSINVGVCIEATNMIGEALNWHSEDASPVSRFEPLLVEPCEDYLEDLGANFYLPCKSAFSGGRVESEDDERVVRTLANLNLCQVLVRKQKSLMRRAASYSKLDSSDSE